MADIELKRKEAVPLIFTIRDKTGVVEDVSAGTFTLTVRETEDSITPEFTKVDGDFDKADAANGIVKVLLSETNLDIQGDFLAELKMSLGTSINKSETYAVEVLKSLSA